MDNSQMYADEILDHYKNPRNKGSIKSPDIKHSGANPLCGDDIEITLKLAGDVIKDVKFMGHGCAISQASMSLLSEKIKNMKLSDVKKLEREDVVTLLGIPVSATRTKCAVLGLVTVKHAIMAHEGTKVKKTTTEGDVPGEGA